jgi:hypothetical protein
MLTILDEYTRESCTFVTVPTTIKSDASRILASVHGKIMRADADTATSSNKMMGMDFS